MPRIVHRLDFKTLVILLGVASTFIGLSFVVLNHVVMPAFEALEEQDAEDNLERVRRAIGSELAYLGNTTADWAFWDHTYEFLQGERESYRAENLTDSTYQTLKLDFIYLYDRSGHLYWGRAIDREGAEITLDEFSGDRLPAGHPLLVPDDDARGRTGVLTTQRGPYLVAARPLIGSDRNRLSIGTLIFGRALGAEALNTIRDQTRVAFRLWTAGDEPPALSEVLDRLKEAPQSIATRPAPGGGEIWSFGVIAGLDGRPSLLLRAQTPRTVTAAGQHVVDLSMALMVAAALLDMTVVGYLLHRLILGPIEELKEQVGNSGPTQTRPPLQWPRKDEIGVLARAIDRLQSDVERHTEELTAAMEHVVAAGQAKASFLASMSHELRTPLNAIIGFSDMMKREVFGPLPDGHYREYADDINTSGEHLLALVNKILDMSKAESGRLELSEEIVDVEELVLDALRMVAPQAAKGGVTVERSIAPSLPQFLGDRLRITEVLLNLLSNAVKFTDAGGRVTVSAWVEPHDELVLRVEDTGIGMADDDVPRALAPFVQLENNSGRRQTGTGLGLALAKKMTELHGGEFALASRLGIGTTATLRFPPSRSHRERLSA